jgi:endonuclease YncB( thermonuclease family)
VRTFIGMTTRLRLWLLLAALLALATPAAADLSSYAIVRADGTLSIAGRLVRLYGIMMPPSERQCRTFERPIECGSRAVLQLEFKIGSNFVHCREMGQDPSGIVVGLCSVEQEDLSAWMLLNGWALTGPDAPFQYVQYERLAQARGFGVWGMPVDNIGRRSHLQQPVAPTQGPPPSPLGARPNALGAPPHALGAPPNALGAPPGIVRP